MIIWTLKRGNFDFTKRLEARLLVGIGWIASKETSKHMAEL